MTRTRAIVAGALALSGALLAAFGPLAEERSDRPVERVLVEEEGERAAEDQTILSTRIRADDFATRITTLEELLQETAGLHVRSYGGLGAFATVSIRGSTAEQVSVYVDGVLLNPALGGGVNLADLPLGGIDSIDIYRGFTPAYLSTGSIGGAINIRTRKPDGGVATSGSVGYGSYSTAEATALTSWSGGPLDGLVSFHARSTQGDFRFFDNNGTPANALDDGYETRRNNEFALVDLSGNLGRDLSGGGRLEMQAALTSRSQGVPGIDAFQSLDADSSLRRLLLRGGLAGRRYHGGSVRLDLDLHAVRTRQAFTDRLGDTSGAGTPADLRNVMSSIGPSLRVEWHPAAGGAARHFVRTQSSFRFETLQRDDRLNPQPDRGRARRGTSSVSLEDEIHLAGSRLVFSPSLRWTRMESRFDAPAGVPHPEALDADSFLEPKIGLAWRPGRTVVLRSNAGRFYRAPSFTEIFGDQGSIRGRADLRPERGLNADIGVSWSPDPRGVLDQAGIEIAVFRTEADELIQFVQTSQSQVVASNTGRARVTGAELSARLGLLGWLGARIDYTWQVAEDRSDTFSRGSDLPGRPRHEGSARLTAGAVDARWGQPFYEFTYIGPSFFDTAAATLGSVAGLPRDLLRVPGRYFHGLGYSRSAGSRCDFTIEVDNVFNIKTVDVVRYPLPGRLVQARLAVRFR